MHYAISEMREEQNTPQWFAIQTRPRFEKKAAGQLAQKNIDVYLPLRTERHAWSDRKQTISTPLFPGYAFVRISARREEWRPVLQTPGLLGFVSFGGKVVDVPAKQIGDLQMLLKENAPFSLHPFLHSGQRVRIRGGCLNGLEGVLIEDKGKLVIAIASIQRSLAIEIKGYELDLV